MPARIDRSSALSCAALLGCAWLVACAPTHGRQPLPDWSAGYDKGKALPGQSSTTLTGAVQFGRHSDLPPDAGMAVVVPDTVTWPIRIRQRDTADSPCWVHGTIDGQPHEIQCVIDVDELDLYVLGLKFDLVVPEGECDYVYTSWYQYQAFPCGVGPTEVSWTVEPDGTISNEVNSQDGIPTCPYDHSKEYPPGPNGCGGRYVQKITDKATGLTTITNLSWGGNVCACMDGAAYLDKDRQLNKAGCAMPLYTYLERKPLLRTQIFRGMSKDYPQITVPLANFYRPSEHMGDPSMEPMPMSANPVVNPGPVEPLYEISCEDDAKEEISHISIAVREWNQEHEFDADGDPDSAGVEPGWNQRCGPLHEDCPIDDFADWDVATPDNTSYLLIGRPD